MEEPRCGKCHGIMTPENSKLRPELFLHDDCLPDEFRPRLRPDAFAPANETILEMAKRKTTQAAKVIDPYSSIRMLSEALQAIIAYLEAPGPK